MSSDRDLFLAYGALMGGALIPIYHGAYASLRTPRSTIEKLKARKELTDAELSEYEDELEESGIPETLTSEDAYWLPVLGSAVLFGMFLVFKYLDKVWVDRVLGFYFACVGSFAVTKAFLAIVMGIIGREKIQKMDTTRFQLSKRVRKGGTSGKESKSQDLLVIRMNNIHPPVVVLSVVIVAAYLWNKHWVLSNILALSLSLSSISLLALDSFKTGSIMLAGLFVYDVFWVFGTNVMVSVARGFDGPIKIVWPKNLVEGLFDGASDWKMTMLGLGDIVIPGIFIALALRYDQHRHAKANENLLITKYDTNFAKPYFKATLVAYVAGLATTMLVMHFTKAAQPALLYLSPACVGAIVITSLRLGQWSETWAYDSNEEDAKYDEKIKKSKKADAINASEANNDEDDEIDDENEEAAWEGVRDNGTSVTQKTTSSTRASTRKRKTSTKTEGK